MPRLSYLATRRTRTGYRAADTPPETPPTTAPVAHEPVTAQITMTTKAVPATTMAMNPLMRSREGAARDMTVTVPRVLAVIATHRSIGETLPVVLRRSFTWDQGPEIRDWKDAAMAAESRSASATRTSLDLDRCRAAVPQGGLRGRPRTCRAPGNAKSRRCVGVACGHCWLWRPPSCSWWGAVR